MGVYAHVGDRLFVHQPSPAQRLDSPVFVRQFMLEPVVEPPSVVFGFCFLCSQAAPRGFQPPRARLFAGQRCLLCFTISETLQSCRALDQESVSYVHCIELIHVAGAYARLRAAGPDSDRAVLDRVEPEAVEESDTPS